MKKAFLLFTTVAVTAIMTSCGGAKTDSAEHAEDTMNEEAPAGEMVNWTIDTEKSSVRWEGGTSGAMVYSHYGQIKIKEGSLTSQGDMLKSGSFAVDLTTINPQDDGYSEEHPSSDLVGHLSSPDFFDVANHPVAKFEVTSVEGNKVMGNLTVRGKTNPETINVESMEMNPDGTMHAKGKLVFDRQKYDVAWEHYMQDVVLADDITLEFDVVAKKA